MMREGLQKMACGGCGNRLYRIYEHPQSGEILLECSKCKSVSAIKVSPANILIHWESGEGCPANYAGDDN